MTDRITDVRELIGSLTVEFTRKIQLDQYEPITAHVGAELDVPEDASPEEVDEIVQEAAEYVTAAAEEAAMRRHEEYVREEAFGDD